MRERERERERDWRGGFGEQIATEYLSIYLSMSMNKENKQEYLRM